MPRSYFAGAVLLDLEVIETKYTTKASKKLVRREVI